MPTLTPVLHRLTLATLVPLAACGGDGSDPLPPEGGGQSVTVSVATTGQDMDTDGYTVTLGSRSEAVEVNGSASFDDVPPGTHTVSITGVAENCSVEGEASRSVSVGESSGAQVAFAVACDVADGLTTVACPDLSLGASSGLPVDRISIGRLPADFDLPLIARVTSGDGTADGFTFVPVGEQGEAELVVPVHPSTDADGGTVQVRVTDGVQACAPFDLAIDALPASAGELAAIVDLVQDVLRMQAAILGTTPEELVATPVDELSSVLIPLAVVQSVIDHPENDMSLAAIANGSSPASAQARLDLIEPMLARMGLRAALEAALADGSGAAGAAGFTGANAPGAGAGFPAVGSSAPAMSLGPRTCTPEGVALGGAGILNECMKAQASAAFELANATGKVLNDLATTTEGMGMVNVGGATTAVVGALGWVVLNEKTRTAALLPSKFTSMTIEASPTEFLEDQPGPGSWFNAQVTAQNEGWDLGKDVIEALLNAAGVAGAAGKAEDLGGPSSPNSFVSGILTGPLVRELIGDGTLEEFKFPVETFGPIPVSDDTYTESSIIGTAFGRSSHTEYDPIEPGSAILSVRTEDGEFGGKQISVQVDLTVDEIALAIAPTEVVVEPDGVKSFVVTIEDATDLSAVEIDPAVPLQGLAEMTYMGDGQHDILYVAPAEPDFDDPDLLTVYYTKMTGTLAEGRRRTAIATIRFGDIEISPRSACLSPGDTFQFDATVEGPSDAPVGWEASVGTIDDGGLYTAPETVPTDGSATIRAFIQTYPDLDDEVTITIGDCGYYAVSITGYQTYNGEGVATFLVTGGETTIWLHGNGDFGGNVYLDGPRPDVGEHEVSESVGSLRRTGYQSFGSWSGEGTVSIESSSAGLLEGTIQLTAIYGGIQGQDISILIEFKAPCDPLAPSCD